MKDVLMKKWNECSCNKDVKYGKEDLLSEDEFNPIYGKEDLLSEDEFNPIYGKEKITLFVDQQVVDAYREKAKKEGSGYQALMIDTLKRSIFSSDISEMKLTREESRY